MELGLPENETKPAPACNLPVSASLSGLTEPLQPSASPHGLFVPVTKSPAWGLLCQGLAGGIRLRLSLGFAAKGPPEAGYGSMEISCIAGTEISHGALGEAYFAFCGLISKLMK